METEETGESRESRDTEELKKTMGDRGDKGVKCDYFIVWLVNGRNFEQIVCIKSPPKL